MCLFFKYVNSSLEAAVTTGWTDTNFVRNVIRKNARVVQVNISANRDNGIPGNQYGWFTIPEGYRPKEDTVIYGIVNKDGWTEHKIITFVVMQNGEFKVGYGQDVEGYVQAQISGTYII